VATICDLFGSEYGWTPDYVLNQLTRRQVDALLQATSRRYQRQSDAMKAAQNEPGTQTTRFDEHMSPTELAAFGIEVHKGSE